MIVMHYAGETFQLSPEEMELVRQSVGEAAKGGQPIWIELALAGDGVSRFLLGPGIPVAFTGIPDHPEER